MEIRNFLADFLCVLLPLFVLDAWQVRSSRASTNVYPTPALLSFIFLISSVITTLFNFRLANHLEVNLSIVPLTLAFYLLSWRLSLLVLAAYAFVEIVAGYFTLSHYHLSLTALHTVLRLLPHGLEILGIYAAMVSLAYFFSKDRTQSQRITIFVLTLFCYTFVDYVFVNAPRLSGAQMDYFITYVLVFNITFVLSIRIVESMRNAQRRRLAERQSDRLKLIGQLSASVAHEVRNPITVVKGFTQLMLSHDYGREKSVEFMQSMMSELERAESIIAHYLQLARTGDDDKSMIRRVDLAGLIAYAVEMLGPYAEVQHVDIRTSIDGNAVVAANPEILSQALVNLVKNAIESIEGSGVVTLSLKEADRRVTVIVTDTGRGIPASELPRLGEPYYSTKTTGTGLGLTFVYKTIHDLGGYIDIKSQVGRGTEIRITLPKLIASPTDHEPKRTRTSMETNTPQFGG